MADNISTMRPTPNAQRPTPNAQRPTPNYAQNSDDVIHVVLCVYDPSGTYAQHAGVVMTSIFENTRSKVIIHIIHDETLTDDNRNHLINTAPKYNQTIHFIDVREHKKHFDQKAIGLARRKCTIGALYRLFIPGIMTDNEKIIYLDCDVIVNLDISEMWNIDINDYCLGGVHSMGYERIDETVRDWLNGCSSKTFINSGVLLMNLKKIRERGDLFMNSTAWIDRRVHLMNFSDQDVINNLFYGSIKLIDRKFNNFNPKTDEQCANSIIHTPTSYYPDKTWGASGLYSQKLYWHYYLCSAFGENITTDKLAEKIIYASVKPVPVYHQRQRPLWKRILRPFVLVARKMLPYMKSSIKTLRTILGYIFKDMYYRLKYAMTHR